MPYTGKKLTNYIWIPKAKSDLKEYRDILILCREIEKSVGYFNDKLLGKTQVEKGGIFDGSLSSGEYFDKYEKKTLGNQSYVSSARMSLRLCRFFGWVTRVPREKGKYKLTDRGELISQFRGKFPNKIGDLSEFDLVLDDILNTRFYCINDNIEYQNKLFKQRPIFNILRFLYDFDYLHNFEIVISALALKNESKEELERARKSLTDLRSGKTTITQQLKTLSINILEKSSITGVYDGPKVLCSFLKQLNLVDNISTVSLGQKVVDRYKEMYKGSPFINDFPRNVFKINTFGKKVFQEMNEKVPVWYEDLPEPKVQSAVLISLIKGGYESTAIQARTNINTSSIEAIRKYINKLGGEDKVIFDYYRDMPPEEYDKFVRLMGEKPESYLKTSPAVFNFYRPKINPSEINDKRCILCFPYLCTSYREFTQTPNSYDYLAYKVCPTEAIAPINKDEKVELKINTEKCSKCMLCYSRCPFSAIYINNEGFPEVLPSATENNDYLLRKITPEEISKEIDVLLEKYKLPRKNSYQLNKIETIKYFEQKISMLGDCWTQDSFYSWVRNVIRGIGLGAIYSGGRGMKTRSDVTVIAPFPVAIEVKSPSEGKVTSKAVRQTTDAAAQLFNKFQRRVYMCAIGQEISPEAVRKANEHKKYQESMGTHNYNILLMPSKVLLYLLLTHQEISFSTNELEILFRDYHNKIDSESLLEYLSQINKKRIESRRLNMDKYSKEIEALFSF